MESTINKGENMLPDGTRVRLHMVQRIEDGSAFIDTHVRGAVADEIIIGRGDVFPALEEAIRGMHPGEKQVFCFAAADAYGERDESRKEVIAKSDFPRADELPLGRYIMVRTGNGTERVKVDEADANHLVFDYNNELAGHDITCEIEVEKVLEDESDLRKREEYFYGDGDGCGCGHTH